MKKYLLFSFILLITGCGSNTQTIYDNKPYNIELNHDPTLKKLNAVDTDKNIVFFMGGFVNDTIQMYSGKELLFRKSFSTGANTGLANYQVISNKEESKILILSIDSKIFLTKEKLKKYKCVYLSKKEKKITVEYSNTFKKFL